MGGGNLHQPGRGGGRGRGRVNQTFSVQEGEREGKYAAGQTQVFIGNPNPSRNSHLSEDLFLEPMEKNKKKTFS